MFQAYNAPYMNHDPDLFHKIYAEIVSLREEIRSSILHHRMSVPIKLVYLILGAMFLGFAGGAGVKLMADWLNVVKHIPLG